MTQGLMECMQYLERGVELYKRLIDGRPLMNWQKALDTWLELKARNSSDKTVTNLTRYLTPFKDWLMQERVRPTAQRIKKYLTDKDYSHDSYKKVGYEIVDFVNFFSEKIDEVELIKPVGAKKKKDRLVMPREVMDALTAHVEERLHRFVPLKENCKSPADHVKLAKYLGKFPPFVSV